MLKKKLQAAISFVLGPPERFPPEHRIFNAMVLTMMLMGFIAVFQNMFVGLPVLTIVLATVILTFFSVIYASSRIKSHYRRHIWPVVFMALVFVAFMWTYNEGSAGGTHLFLAIAPLLFILFINDRQRYVFLLLYLCVTVGLLIIEYTHPSIVHGRLPHHAHFLDMLSATVQTQVIIAVIVSWAVKEYRKMLGRVEHLRRKSEERFSEIADQIPAVICESDLDQKFTYANRAAYQLTGYTPEDLERGMYANNVIHPDEIETMKEGISFLFAGKETPSREYRIISKDGTVKIVLTKAAIIHTEGKISGIRSYMIDVTEKKKLEEQLRQAQKMESIGQLAGGIAHDFNNILTGILTSAQLIEQQSASIDRKEITALVGPIIAASTRAAELVKNLLTFSRQKTYLNEAFNLRKTVDDAVAIMSHAIDKKIEIVQKQESGTLVVRGDQSLVESAVINLVVNARDAMPDGGRLTIEIIRTKADSGVLRAHPDLTAGKDYAVVSVCDTGKGFDDEAKKHLFEPFFTTKEHGRGTGLGLASVFGVVKGHNGSIEVTSGADGAGTRVAMYLPLHGGACEPHGLQPEAAAPEKGKGETILVVDDEAIILRTMEMVLSKQGYTVKAIGDPVAAVDYFRANAAHIACVILDIIMPKMNGITCYSHLRAVNPSVKVIVTTGYADDLAFEEFVEMNHLTVVSKPFDVAVLLDAIRRVLYSA
jgi:two-component system, cell cycle sensor histidine kinase and response regulator CckA